MKRTFPGWSGFAMAVLVPAWLLSVPPTAGGTRARGARAAASGGSHSSGGSHQRRLAWQWPAAAAAQQRLAQQWLARQWRQRRLAWRQQRWLARRRVHPFARRERGGRGGVGGSGTTSNGGTAVRRGSTGRRLHQAAPIRLHRTAVREWQAGRRPGGPAHRPPACNGRHGGTAAAARFSCPGYYPWGFGGIGLGGYYGGYYDPWDPYGRRRRWRAAIQSAVGGGQLAAPEDQAQRSLGVCRRLLRRRGRRFRRRLPAAAPRIGSAPARNPRARLRDARIRRAACAGSHDDATRGSSRKIQ